MPGPGDAVAPLMDPLFWLSLGGALTLAFEHWVIPWALELAARRATARRGR